MSNSPDRSDGIVGETGVNQSCSMLELTTKNTLVIYYVCLVFTIIIAAVGLFSGYGGDLILTVPVIIILAGTIFSDRDFLHIPPAMIFLMVGTFLLSSAGRLVNDGFIGLLASILMGVNLELIGIVCVYMMLNSISGTSNEKSRLVLPVSISIAVFIFVMITMMQYYLSSIWSIMDPVDLDIMMSEILLVMVGALIVGLMYRSARMRSMFTHTVTDFLENNSDKMSVEENRRRSVLRMVQEGESDKLEFKSTLRTNLATGENDKRMEMVVLKTIVAFLNTDGGTLMVGVSDDGTICGVDLESFENKDKLNLHFTNMLASSIGNEFLPYIKFHLIDFEDGKSVLRVSCAKSKRPVFLKDGKIERFYVRSGPSSVEITGRNLVNYVKNRSRKVRQEIVSSTETE